MIMLLTFPLLGLLVAGAEFESAYNPTFGAICPALLEQTPEPTLESRVLLRDALESASDRARELRQRFRLKPSKLAATVYGADGRVFAPRPRTLTKTSSEVSAQSGFSVSLERLEQLGFDVYAIREGTVARGVMIRGAPQISAYFARVRNSALRNQRQFEPEFERLFPYVTRWRLGRIGLAFATSAAVGTYFGVNSYDLLVNSDLGGRAIFGLWLNSTLAACALENCRSGWTYMRGLVNSKHRRQFERRFGFNRPTDYLTSFEKLADEVRGPKTFDDDGYIHLWRDVVLDAADVDDLKAAAIEGRGPRDEFYREFDRARLVDRDVYDVDVAFKFKLDHVLYRDGDELVLLAFDRFVRVEKAGRNKKPRDEVRQGWREFSGPLAPVGI